MVLKHCSNVVVFRRWWSAQQHFHIWTVLIHCENERFVPKPLACFPQSPVMFTVHHRRAGQSKRHSRASLMACIVGHDDGNSSSSSSSAWNRVCRVHLVQPAGQTLQWHSGEIRRFNSRRFIRSPGRSGDQRHTPTPVNLAARLRCLAHFSKQKIYGPEGRAAGGMKEWKQNKTGRMGQMSPSQLRLFVSFVHDKWMHPTKREMPPFEGKTVDAGLKAPRSETLNSLSRTSNSVKTSRSVVISCYQILLIFNNAKDQTGHIVSQKMLRQCSDALVGKEILLEMVSMNMVE